MGRESIEQLNKVKFFSAGSAEDRAADLETIAGNLETISNRIKNLIGDLGLEGETGTAADEALGNASTAAVHGSEFVKVIAEARRLAATAGRNAVQVQEEVEKSVGDADSTFSNATPATEKGGDTLSASSVSAYDKAVKAHDAAVEAANTKAQTALTTLDTETQSAIAKLNTLWPDESGSGGSGSGGFGGGSSSTGGSQTSGGGQSAGDANRGVSPTHSAAQWQSTAALRPSVGLPGNSAEGVHLESVKHPYESSANGTLASAHAVRSGLASPALSTNATVAGLAGLGGATAAGAAGVKAYRAAKKTRTATAAAEASTPGASLNQQVMASGATRVRMQAPFSRSSPFMINESSTSATKTNLSPNLVKAATDAITRAAYSASSSCPTL